MSADLRHPPIDLAHEAAFTLAGLQVRPAKLEVVAGDRREILEPRIMQVLVALARQRGEVVSRDDLIQSCWGGRIVGEDSINRCIFQLRKLAEQVGGFTLETVPRVGYRLTEASASTITGRSRRLAWILGALAVAVLIAVVAGLWVARRSIIVEAPYVPRVAVAGFKPLSDDAAARNFGATVADAAAGVLGEHALMVESPSAQADLVVGGSVLRDGAAWRIRAHMEDVRSGFTLWSQDFERPVGEEAPLRDEITVAITDAVYFATDPLKEPGLKADPRTVALYIRAAKMMSTPDPRERGQAEALMQEVLKRAPDFAGARGVLADNLVGGLYGSPPGPQRSAQRQRVLNEASEAIRRDPRAGAGAYDALYLLARVDHPSDLVAAEDGLLKGIAAAPDYHWILMRECRLLIEVGRAAEALRYCERARAIRPLAPPIDWAYAQAFEAGGELDRADEAAEQSARYHPAHGGSRALRFELAAFFGTPDDGLARLSDLRRPPQLIDQQIAATMALFLRARKSGASADADQALAAMWTDARRVREPRWLVFAAAQLGRPDDAFAALDELGVLGPRPVGVTFGTLLDPAAAPLRSDPRFWREAAKAGYLDYWRRRGIWPDFCADPKLGFDCRIAAAKATAPAS